MITLTNTTVDEWLSVASSFSYDFSHFALLQHRALGVDIEFVSPEIEAAHAEWVATVHQWRNTLFRQDTESLSYTKIFAILLWSLSQRQYLGDIRKFVPTGHREDPIFNGPEEMRAAIVADLLGAPEIVSAIDFCIPVLAFYESKRTDRIEPYQFRMTPVLRHDLIVLLSTEKPSPLAIYLVLEAIFGRR